jgi:predicted nucleic acid-binding protein
MGYLIDTCIWIDVERGIISPADVAFYTKNEPVYLSPITVAELTFGVQKSQNDNIRQKRAAALNRLKKKPLLIIDENTGDIFGRTAAVLLDSGRDSSFRVQDIWLASQAIQHNLKFLTKNQKDFMDIPGLDLVLFRQQ